MIRGPCQSSRSMALARRIVALGTRMRLGAKISPPIGEVMTFRNLVPRVFSLFNMAAAWHVEKREDPGDEVGHFTPSQ